VDLRLVNLIPQQGGSFYTPTQWVGLMTSALAASAIGAAYCRDDRAVLQDAYVTRAIPKIEISFRNMTSQLLMECRARQKQGGGTSGGFGEGNACVAFLDKNMAVADLENLLHLSSFLSFLSCSTSLFIEASIGRVQEQSPQQVMIGAIDAISDAVELFYFG
jgi:hypothetical protein